MGSSRMYSVRPRVALGELGGELDALRLAARERRGRLAEVDVAEPDVVEQLELLGDAPLRAEEVEGVRDGEVEHVGDALALVAHLERLAVVALPLAHLARARTRRAGSASRSAPGRRPRTPRSGRPSR